MVAQKKQKKQKNQKNQKNKKIKKNQKMTNEIKNNFLQVTASLIYFTIGIV